MQQTKSTCSLGQCLPHSFRKPFAQCLHNRCCCRTQTIPLPSQRENQIEHRGVQAHISKVSKYQCMRPYLRQPTVNWVSLTQYQQGRQVACVEEYFEGRRIAVQCQNTNTSYAQQQRLALLNKPVRCAFSFSARVLCHTPVHDLQHWGPNTACHEYASSKRGTARQHKVAEVACYRLERTLMGCADPP